MYMNAFGFGSQEPPFYLRRPVIIHAAELN